MISGNHQIVILLYIKRYRQKVKRTHKEWEETFANHPSSRDLCPPDYIKSLPLSKSVKKNSWKMGKS